ncbi:type II toxin-antitoxin system VapC family toxin [Phenylobacterium aquaticum]|uniref:type II toxin-antitoxin system VapC family toxin n=1 Tax=Phenylobacterium aquaticum TaxID=1763816 RepID=UPI0026EF6954|nr:type II toxin-antitoxin system VapC family toxin [Phenylobacterium aquaticum]
MRLLLDTHILLWAAAGGPDAGAPGAMPIAAKALIQDPGNDLVFSAASIWEVAIKTGLGRSDFQVDAHLLRRGLLDNGYEELAISGVHAAAVGQLPPIHRDPFDRLLVAQAAAEGLTLVTSDAVVASYPGPIRAV